jgi:hypothetical protein
VKLLGLWVLLAAEQATSQLRFFLSLVVSLPCDDLCFYAHSSSDGRKMRLELDVRMHKHAPMPCLFYVWVPCCAAQGMQCCSAAAEGCYL